MKQFDQKLYDECDTPARAAAKSLLADLDVVVKESNLVGIDLLLYKGDKQLAAVELEVRKGTSLHEIVNKPTVTYPARKQKFLEYEIPVIFVSFNSDCSEHYCAPGEWIRLSPLKFSEKLGEYFFHLDSRHVKMNGLRDMIKRLL